MKIHAASLVLMFAGSLVCAQSGRRMPDVTSPTPADQIAAPTPLARLTQSARSLADTGLDYRCLKGGSHRRTFPGDEGTEHVLSSKAVDRRAIFRAKPRPGYTLEAHRNRKQGFVILKVALSATGDISRVRVLRGLPFGLTESAIKAACQLQFQPAMKDGQRVSQWVTAEYVFRLPDSRLFRP